MKALLSWLVVVLLLPAVPLARGADRLADGWRNPPTDARLRAYWWWLNGNVTKEAITPANSPKSASMASPAASSGRRRSAWTPANG